MTNEQKIVLHLVGFYIFVLIGFSTPLVLVFYDFNSLGVQYKLIVPTISGLLVSQFQKSASSLLEDTGSFGIPGVYELRQKYLLHVNRIEKIWLGLAIWAVILAAL